jgi:hypothetical protein
MRVRDYFGERNVRYQWFARHEGVRKSIRYINEQGARDARPLETALRMVLLGYGDGNS